MADLYDYYHAWDNTQEYVWTIYWRAQSFTTSAAYTIKSVKMLMHRVGSPGMIYVKIRETSGGLPIHPDLCSGETNGNTLPVGSTNAEWREITLGAGVNLVSGKQYAIVVNVPGGGPTVYVCPRASSTLGYPGGTNIRSNNNDASWFINEDYELLFETWGDPILPPPSGKADDNALVKGGFI